MTLIIFLRYQNSGDEFVASAIVGIIFFGAIALYRMAKDKVKNKTIVAPKNQEMKSDIHSKIIAQRPSYIPDLPKSMEHLRGKLEQDETLRKVTDDIIEANRKKIFNATIHPILGIRRTSNDPIFPRIFKDDFIEFLNTRTDIYDARQMIESSGELNFIIGASTLKLPEFFFANNSFDKKMYCDSIIIVSGFQNDITTGNEVLAVQSIRFNDFDSLGMCFAFILNYLPYDVDRQLLQEAKIRFKYRLSAEVNIDPMFDDSKKDYSIIITYSEIEQ